MGTFLLGVLLTTYVVGIIVIGILTLSISKLKKELFKLKKQSQVSLSDCRNDDLLIHKRIDGEIDRVDKLFTILSKDISNLSREVKEVVIEPKISASVKEKKKKKVL